MILSLSFIDSLPSIYVISNPLLDLSSIATVRYCYLSIRGLINLLLRTFDAMFHKEVRRYLLFPSKQFLAQSKLAWLFPFECYQITLYDVL